jgi:hypothetical protein
MDQRNMLSGRAWSAGLTWSCDGTLCKPFSRLYAPAWALQDAHAALPLVEAKIFLGLFPWNTRAALSSALGGKKVAEVFEVVDSLTQARHCGSQFTQRRLVVFL